MRRDFTDDICQGDTIRRAAYLEDRDTRERQPLIGHTATYTARKADGTGTPITATKTAVGNETELVPELNTAANVPVGDYDVWLHLQAPDGSLAQTLTGRLRIAAKAPTA